MALTNRISIDAREDPQGRVTLDGRLLEGVRSATLTMRVGSIPELEVEFLTTGDIANLDGEVRYIAWAFGEYAKADTPEAVLRQIADALEAKATAARHPDLTDFRNAGAI